MEIVIIGTGNVATILGRKLKAAGHVIKQICGRTKEAADGLAAQLNALPCYAMADVDRNAGFYLIALADNALINIEQQLQLPGRLVAHTAGSVSKEALGKVSTRYGVFYPLQSLRKEMVEIPDIPLFVDAANQEDRNILHMLAHSISRFVSDANDEQRMQLHLAAVLVNNFTNHLFVLAEKYCTEHGLDFKLLLPLIRETVNRLEQYSPQEAQTGPAVRNDTVTIQKHIAMLKDDPALRELYERMTKSIIVRREA